MLFRQVHIWTLSNDGRTKERRTEVRSSAAQSGSFSKCVSQGCVKHAHTPRKIPCNFPWRAYIGNACAESMTWLLSFRWISTRKICKSSIYVHVPYTNNGEKTVVCIARAMLCKKYIGKTEKRASKRLRFSDLLHLALVVTDCIKKYMYIYFSFFTGL